MIKIIIIVPLHHTELRPFYMDLHLFFMFYSISVKLFNFQIFCKESCNSILIYLVYANAIATRLLYAFMCICVYLKWFIF